MIRGAIKGELPLIPAAKRLQDELLAPSAAVPFADEAPLGQEDRAVAAFKKVALIVLGTAMQTGGQKLNDEQEVLGCVADIMIDTYAAESAVLRARSASAAGGPRTDLHLAAARTFVNDAAQRVEQAAPNRPGGHRRRRHASHAPGRPAPRAQGHSGQHRRPSAAAREASVEQGRYILEW